MVTYKMGENNNDMTSMYDNIVDQIKDIETENLEDNVNQTPSTKVIEEQKVYFWVRLFIKEEVTDLKEGDIFNIKYKGDETLSSQFITYSKKNIKRDVVDGILGYDAEDDKKCLCLMVDEDRVKRKSDDIPFIRTLFKTSPFYEFQLYKRDDLTFTNKRTKVTYSYIDVDF